MASHNVSIGNGINGIRQLCRFIGEAAWRSNSEMGGDNQNTAGAWRQSGSVSLSWQ